MPFKLTLTLLLVSFIVTASRIRPAASSRPAPSLQQFLYSSERLKLMTWNIGRARLGGDQSSRWEDLPHIAEVIRRNQPSVVALQELEGRDQARSLVRRLRPQYRGWSVGSLRGSSVAILLHRKQRVEAAFPLSTRTGRRALAVVFEVERVAKPVAVVSLHAHPFDGRQRRLYLEDIVWQVNRHHSGIAFLAGDFNFDLASDASRDSLGENLTHDSESYTLLTQRFLDASKAGGPTALLGRRLDYVFARPKDLQVAKVEVLKAAVGEMDHQPVIAWMDLPAKARFKLGS